MNDDFYICRLPRIKKEKLAGFKNLLKRLNIEPSKMLAAFTENVKLLDNKLLEVINRFKYENSYYMPVILLLKEYAEDGDYMIIEENSTRKKRKIYFYKHGYYHIRDLTKNKNGILDCIISRKEPNYLDYSDNKKEQFRKFYIYGLLDAVKIRTR